MDQVDVVGDDVAISSVELDSRHVAAGALFCCLRGAHSDGHDFAARAVAAGADRAARRSSDRCRRAPSDRSRHALGDGSVGGGVLRPSQPTTDPDRRHRHQRQDDDHQPDRLDPRRAAGRSTGFIGTLTGTHTTPESPELQARLAAFVNDGVTAVVMEVSSHALELQRVVGCHFDIAVFTNLGRDHLDLCVFFFLTVPSCSPPSLRRRQGLSTHHPARFERLARVSSGWSSSAPSAVFEAGMW